MIAALLPLLRNRWRDALLLAAVLAALGLWRQYRAGLLAQGRLEQRLAVAAAVRVALEDSITQVERRIDTVRVERVRWQRKLDSFPLPPIHDTIADTVRVEVAAGTVRACGLALSSCRLENGFLMRRLDLERDRRVNDSIAWVHPRRRGVPAWQAIGLAALSFGLGRALR